MANTVIGIYDHYNQAQAAQNDLLASGFARTDVRLSPSEESPAARRDLLGSEHQTSESGSGIGHFFRQLFGMSDKSEVDIYSEALRRGSFLLTIDADDDAKRDQAIDIMNRHDPVDIDERLAQWKNEGWTGTDASAPGAARQDLGAQDSTTQGQSSATGTKVENEISIPVIQEEIAVGKRQVQRGGVRVFQRVTETPVQETVQLREEHVSVERRPVDQPASEADMAAFTDGSFELRETAEEAVVAKTARVVEEVVVNKEVTEKTATVSDTVRRSDVEVEAIPGVQTSGADDEFRQHWQASYGASGGRYEDYAPAYQYGSQLAASEKFRGHRWSDAESDVRSDWEMRNPGSKWEKIKDSVRFGWERMTR